MTHPLLCCACLVLAGLAHGWDGVTEEDHHALTADGWRIALHRYRPQRPRYREPVLLTHGFIENRRIWDLAEDRSLARDLAGRGFDVWALELRGSGESAPGSLYPLVGDWLARQATPFPYPETRNSLAR